MEVECNVCNKKFTKRSDALRHFRIAHDNAAPHFQCDRCGYATSYSSTFRRHQDCCKPPSSSKANVSLTHDHDDEPAAKAAKIQQITDLSSRLDDDDEISNIKIEIIHDQINMKVHRISPSSATPDYVQFSSDATPMVNDSIAAGLKEHNGVKFQLRMSVKFRKALHPEIVETFSFAPTSSPPILLTTDYNRLVADCLKEIETRIEDLQERESGWIVDTIEFLDCYINRYQPFRFM